MTDIHYALGSCGLLDALFPPAKLANPDVGLTDQPSVIAHYTKNSLVADGLADAVVKVTQSDGQYWVGIKANVPQQTLDSFAENHQNLFSPQAAGKAVVGADLLKKMGVWNPMKGYVVNRNPSDGTCKWALFPPLGLNVMGQRAILLMHYPPWQTLQQASFLNVMTMNRWNTLLEACGVPKDEVSFFRTIVDINPIAAPGSGQSEYANDYFPLMMASGFFDGGPDRDYIISMLELYLNGPNAAGEKHTLPLLVCGSPLYDPQAPSWFRTKYVSDMPQNDDGIPVTDVLQAGKIRLSPQSTRDTPYMIANHMIAAGVTGKCTHDPAKIPDIRMYEAQDLTAATFLYEYAKNPDIDPAAAKAAASTRWFGNPDGEGPPKPADPKDAQILCAMAQMDLFFSYGPPPHPTYTFDEAMKRCAGADNDTCGCAIGPTDPRKRGC